MAPVRRVWLLLQGVTPPLSATPTLRYVGRGRRALVQLQGGGQVRLQRLGVVTGVERQQQAVGQSQQDVPRRPGHRLVTGEPWRWNRVSRTLSRCHTGRRVRQSMNQ